MSAGSCQIHLRDEARRKAAAASYPIPALALPTHNTDPDVYITQVNKHNLKYADELQAQREFTGPHFKDCVAEVRFDDAAWVHVILAGPEPSTTYSYPASDVARVKTYR